MCPSRRFPKTKQSASAASGLVSRAQQKAAQNIFIAKNIYVCYNFIIDKE